MATLQGLTIFNFIAESQPVFMEWLSSEMAKLDGDENIAWIPKVYQRLNRPGVSLVEWGDLGSMPQWMSRMETEDFPSTTLPVPTYLRQGVEQYASQYPISREYFEEADFIKKRDELSQQYMQMLAEAAMDTRSYLAVLPWLDAFDGELYETVDGEPLCSTHVLPGGTHTNVTDMPLSTDALDVVKASVSEIFTDQGIPRTFKHDMLMVGDELEDLALDITMATGRYDGNQNVRNRYGNYKTVIVNPWFRDDVLTNGSTMWFSMSSRMLKFDEIWSMTPNIDVYEEKKNLTFYVRGRMKTTHLWKSPVGVFGSTGDGS